MNGSMDVIDIRNRPELQGLAEELRRSKRPHLLTDANGEIATITPARRRAPKSQPVTLDDPLFELIGIGESSIPGGVSERKHEYLLEAYGTHHAR
jgi:hypothetical protein